MATTIRVYRSTDTSGTNRVQVGTDYLDAVVSGNFSVNVPTTGWSPGTYYIQATAQDVTNGKTVSPFSSPVSLVVTSPSSGITLFASDSAFLASGSGAAISLNIPVGVQTNDIVLVQAGANSTTTGVILSTDNAGAWTAASIYNTSTRPQGVWWRRWTASGNPSSVQFINSESINLQQNIVVSVWRGCHTTATPIYGTAAYASAASQVIPSITTTAANCVVVLCTTSGSTAAQNYTMATPTTGVPTTAAVNLYMRGLFYGTKAVAGATGDSTFAWSDAASHTGTGVLIGLVPA